MQENHQDSPSNSNSKSGTASKGLEPQQARSGVVPGSSDHSTAKPPARPSVVSRLGRGLGSLIPAAPSQQTNQPTSQQTSSPNRAPVAPPPPTARTQAEPQADKRHLPQPQERSTGNTPPLPSTKHSTGVEELSISFIARNARQPREKFDDRAIQSLADSIRQHGLLQPVVVRKLRLPIGGKTHELIAGERRLRAFEALGKKEIPAILRDADESQSAVFALIENVQREDLNPLERAKALQRLISDFSWTQQQAAEKVGLDRASVANLLRLNDLDPFCAGCVREGRLAQGHAKALLALENIQVRRSVAEKSLHDEWSVRQLEREVQRLKTASGLSAPPPVAIPRKGSAQIGDLEKRLGNHLGSKVRIKKGRKLGTGKLSIEFYSLDQFDGILQKLGFDPNSLTY